MIIRVKDILNTSLFRDAKVIAGARGLNNIVRHVSVSDNPIDNYKENIELSKKGDFYLTALHGMHESKSMMFDFFKTQISTSSSGICIIDQYIDDIDDEIKEYCNSKKYPVIMISWRVPYSEMIETISKLLFSTQQYNLNEKRIDMLINNRLSSEKFKEIASMIIPEYKIIDDILCAYFRFNKIDPQQINKLSQTFTDIDNIEICYYKDGFLYFIYDHIIDKETKKRCLNYIEDTIDSFELEYNYGVSDIDSKPSYKSISRVIKQALIAYDSALISYQKRSYYNELGINKILLPYKSSKEFLEFASSTLNPLIEYDYENNANLLETVECFIKNDMHYRKTSLEMFVHENTIRYRIKKVVEIVGANDSLLDVILRISFSLKIIDNKNSTL